jgi:exopolysaccharide biosynthesis polyprenyl glycosylphosphotransferase
MKLSSQSPEQVDPVSPEIRGIQRGHFVDSKSKNDHLHDVLIIIAAIGDVVCFMAAMLVAYYLRRNLTNLHVASDFIELTWPLVSYTGHFVFGICLFLALAGRAGMYDTHHFFRLRHILIAAMNTVILWALFYVCLSLLFSFRPNISRLYVLFSAVIGFGFVIYWRILFRRILNRNGILARLRQRVVVVGWSQEVDFLAREIVNDLYHPYEIVGCLPSAQNKYRSEPPSDVKKLGNYQDLDEVRKRENVDIILLGDLDPDTKEIISLCEYCQREMVQFKVVPTYFQILISGLHLQTISGVPVLGIAKLPLDSLPSRLVKRGMDIVGAVVGLVLSAPLVLIFGALVYWESPGPVIYSQARMGRRGELFNIYKIRSMHLDAERDGARRAVVNDQRRLKIGAVMRRWNIDEVPQFWNVLVGDMSLVGPRPEILGLIDDLKDQIRHYNARHNIKPGMTGWAQIHGLRGDTDLAERLRYDLYYLENWTPILDIYIMALTFRGSMNAY